MSSVDTSGPHERKCWDCGNVAFHLDNIKPEVCCKKCGSQDTRIVKKKVVEQSSEKTLGQVAYESHRDSVFNGNPGDKFQWCNLTNVVKSAWQAAAEAAVEEAERRKQPVNIGMTRVPYPPVLIEDNCLISQEEKQRLIDESVAWYKENWGVDLTPKPRIPADAKETTCD